MKLITEAALDDQFNVQMGKIQDAIKKLQDLSKKFDRSMHMPVRSQVTALNTASKDLETLAMVLGALRL